MRDVCIQFDYMFKMLSLEILYQNIKENRWIIRSSFYLTLFPSLDLHVVSCVSYFALIQRTEKLPTSNIFLNFEMLKKLNTHTHKKK